MFSIKGSKVTLLTCVLIHFFIVTTNNWIKHVLVSYIAITWNVSQGIAYLMYPLLGWIADIRVTHYKIIKSSFVFVLISSFLMFGNCIVKILNPHVLILEESLVHFINISTFTCILLIGIAGFGLYESNAIQFGMDQMLEASSEELSSFIHWYYWSVHLGQLIIFYILTTVITYLQNCKVHLDRKTGQKSDFATGWMFIFPSVIQAILIIIGLFVIIKSKSHLYIDSTRINPLKNIFKVLHFAWKHKYPVNRSAFTYWENDIPSRIDLSKHKYGGPFTNEQVEDIKTLFQLLLLILSLFGFQLAGDGYSLSQYMMHNLGCPTMWTMRLLVMNPEHITVLVILIGIPLNEFLIKKYLVRYIPTLLNKVKIGLYICLIREMIYPFISLSLYSTENDSSCFENNLYAFTGDNSSIITSCIVGRARALINETCEIVCPGVFVHRNLFLLIIIPQILHGLAYLFVFMTVLEFICAQAPHTLKGLLIGIWYASFSIKYFTVGVLDAYMIDKTTWNIYHGVKGFGIFLSMVFFSLVCKFYRYRERDEIVNEQAIIEEQYERELLLNT